MAAAVIARRRGLRSLLSISNQVREMSELVQKNSKVRRFEGQGVESKHAEDHHFSSLDREIENLEEEIEKMRKDHHFSSLDLEIENLEEEIEKMGNEFKVGIEKLRSMQRMNYKRMQTKHRVDNEKMRSRLKADIHALKAQFEDGRNDVTKFYIGTLVSFFALGLAIFKILK